jgi:hypothetical protein
MNSCYVCNETELIEEHHIIPQTRGGIDEFTVFLCIRCHKKSHYIARSKTKLSLIKNLKLRKLVKVIRLSELLLEHADTYNVTIAMSKKDFILLGVEAKKYKVAKARLLSKIVSNHFSKIRIGG